MGDLDDLYAQIPKLRAAVHRITSPDSDRYNCVAWVERDLDRWWEPGFYWPFGSPTPRGDEDLDCYVYLFRKLGFEVCESSTLEPGFLKIALYAEDDEFHHVAKQLPSGQWSSKAGTLHDFKHEKLEALEDSGVMKNARPVMFMRRPFSGSDPMALEESGLLLP